MTSYTPSPFIRQTIDEHGPFVLYRSFLDDHPGQNVRDLAYHRALRDGTPDRAHRVIYDLRTDRPLKYFEASPEGWTAEQHRLAAAMVKSLNRGYLRLKAAEKEAS